MSKIHCETCGITVIVLVEGQIRTSGVKCYCTACDKERSGMIRAFGQSASKKTDDGGFSDMFGEFFGGKK